MKWTIAAAALEAAATGLLLFIRPSLFAWLVFNAEFSLPGQALARLAAIALFGLSLATWPTPDAMSHKLASVRALAIYNLLAAAYLFYLGLGGELTGILLWPAVVLHAGFAILLCRIWPGMSDR